MAHRYSWMLHFGEIPEGLQVCHHCDNRACVRPDHLFLGTAKDNTQDIIKKGRPIGRPRGAVYKPHPLQIDSARVQGELNPKAKLTAAQVLEIRARWAAGERNQRRMGREFGVSYASIARIVHGTGWLAVIRSAEK